MPSFNPGIWAQEPQSGFLIMVSNFATWKKISQWSLKIAEPFIHLAFHTNILQHQISFQGIDLILRVSSDTIENFYSINTLVDLLEGKFCRRIELAN